MKKQLLYNFTAITIAATLLSSCASYNSSTLTNLSPQIIHSDAKIDKIEDCISVTAKTFTKSDCKQYLDRDVIAKGYQPVQLYIQNNSNNNYSFLVNRVGLSCARADEVAKKVHTSTVGRVVGYSAAAFLTCGLFIIPAIVDGIKSSEANEALDNDFLSKTARDQLIAPHSHFNKLIFVPVTEYQNDFNITLINCESNEPETFNLVAN